jgi:hypothetical protein
LTCYSALQFSVEKSLEREWFSKIENQANVDLGLLKKIYYAGDWDYSLAQYERFISDYGGGYWITEEEFKKTVLSVRRMWTPIDEVLSVLQEIVRILSDVHEETYWYSNETTPIAFLSLLKLLKQVKENGGKRVRLAIE